MNPEELLSGKINMPQINDVAAWASGVHERLCRLWRLAQSDDRRTSVNSLWVMTHLPETDAGWLLSLRDDLIDMLMAENDAGKKRMLLQILREQECGADDMRTEFLDYCMSKINSECEPCSVRCFCVYAAYNMCRHFPELLAELEAHLEMMRYQALSPGLKSALRQTENKITKLKKQ